MQLVVLPRWQVAEPHGIFLQDLAIFRWHGRCSICVRLPDSGIHLKALLWSTLAALSVCGCHARQAEALSTPPTASPAAPTRAVVSTNAGRDETQVAGAMVAVKGSCPLLTFSVAGTMIWMDSTTVLNGLSCAQLTNGTTVRVSGLRRQDRSILASTISAL
jgi:hypothetical protein